MWGSRCNFALIVHRNRDIDTGHWGTSNFTAATLRYRSLASFVDVGVSSTRKTYPGNGSVTVRFLFILSCPDIEISRGGGVFAEPSWMETDVKFRSVIAA